MSLIPRHIKIINILNKIKKITVQELTKRLTVSEVTIRKDLSLLEEQGKLIRTHGGAILAEDENQIQTIQVRRQENINKKIAIARRAKEFITEGDTIFLDAGSTCFYLAKEIRTMHLRVITNSINILVELADTENINLHSVGGSFRKDAGSFIGPIAIETIQNFQVGLSFLGTTGFSEDGIFSSQNIIESRFKSAILKISSRKILLCDSSKFKKKAFAVFALPEDIDVLITDKDFSAEKKFQAMGIEVVLAAK